MKESRVGRTWCSLLNWPLSFIAGSYSIFGFSNTGGAIGSFIDNLFSGPSARVWFTAFDGGSWGIPDIPISQEGHTKTSEGPALAMYNGRLYAAYKSSSTNELWYNVFDGTSWLAQDIKITEGGKVKTGRGPALAAVTPYLVMVYRDGS